jgi:hypothetical protein
VFGALSAVLANDERNDFHHGNALCSDFDERFDIIPQDVHLNVTTGILDASRVLRAVRFLPGDLSLSAKAREPIVTRYASLVRANRR